MASRRTCREVNRLSLAGRALTRPGRPSYTPAIRQNPSLPGLRRSLDDADTDEPVHGRSLPSFIVASTPSGRLPGAWPKRGAPSHDLAHRQPGGAARPKNGSANISCGSLQSFETRSSLVVNARPLPAVSARRASGFSRRCAATVRSCRSASTLSGREAGSHPARRRNAQCDARFCPAAVRAASTSAATTIRWARPGGQSTSNAGGSAARSRRAERRRRLIRNAPLDNLAPGVNDDGSGTLRSPSSCAHLQPERHRLRRYR